MLSSLAARNSPASIWTDVPWAAYAAHLRPIPGVRWSGRGTVEAAWDVEWAVRAILGPPLRVRASTADSAPGLPAYEAAGYREKLRPYQKAAVAFLAERDYALLADPPRVGKSLELLAAGVLVGAKRALIVCPALAKWVWTREIRRWRPDATIALLEGRAADEVRTICNVCDGRRGVPGAYCPTCLAANGQSYGEHLHRGTAGIDVAIEHADYVIVNYDLLIAQSATDAAGVEFVREDLGGWCHTLARYRFDLAILDECHAIRGATYNVRRLGQTRRERVRALVAPIPRVWGASGTPIYGFARDLWGQLDVLSGGAWGHYLTFTARYCLGHPGSHGGWEADGYGPFTGELERRLPHVMLRRARAEIVPDMPPKTRQVIEIDVESAAESRAALGQGDRREGLAGALTAAFQAKLGAVAKAIATEVLAGEKVLAYTHRRASAVALHDAIAERLEAPGVRARARAVNAKTWRVHGEVDEKIREAMAGAFRAHEGAAAFVATIDSMQVAISMLGATAVHFAELHWQPAALIQAEDRPYEPTITRGLTVIYWIARETSDEAVIAAVLPKLEVLDRLMHEADARGIGAALGGAAERETFEDVWRRLTAHLEAPRSCA